MPAQVTLPATLLLRLLCLGCGLLILVAPVQYAARSSQAQSPPEISPFAVERLVSVGDRNLYVRCEGAGSPWVFLAHGLGGSSSEWADVQEEIARYTTVCAYDRAGEGRSDADPGPPHNAKDASRDLAALLEAMQIDEPIVLAGFSLGGLLARHFAVTHPASVAWLVLIDPTPPVWTAMNMSGAAIEPRIDALLRFSGAHPRVAEQLDILKASEEVFVLGAPQMPVTMLTSGVKSLNAGMAADSRSHLATRLQNDQARELDAEHRIVAGCTHAMPVDCPDDVSAAIISALEEVRRNSTEPTIDDPSAILPDHSKPRRITKKRTRRLVVASLRSFVATFDHGPAQRHGPYASSSLRSATGRHTSRPLRICDSYSPLPRSGEGLGVRDYPAVGSGVSGEGLPVSPSRRLAVSPSPSQGTGSYPPLQNGLHRTIRRTVSQPPFKMPYLLIAS